MKKNIIITLIIFFTQINIIASNNFFTHNKVVTNPNEASYIYDRNELSKIVETINIVNELFVGEADTKKDKLYQAALDGIIASLDDPYSAYLDPVEFKSLNEEIDGEYSGVGMTIKKPKGEYLEVESPFIGTPAYKAGLMIGDKILKIDGKDTRKYTAIEVSKMLRGKKGTKVVVEVLKLKTGKKETITLIRDNVKLENVEAKMLNKDLGYISLLNFGTHTGTEIENAIIKLKKEGMKKLIFDLRTNPGGSLNEAVDIASLFVPEKLMVTLNYKNNNKKEFNRTLSYQGDFPMVILTNSGSASASEIVTGILKDYKRATIIGEKTYGKGVAQSIIPFKTGDAIKLTVAKYSTPYNDDINKKGIKPDIRIPMNIMLAVKGFSNETEQAKQNRHKSILEILSKLEGEEKAAEIAKKGDVQLKAAISYLNGEKVESVPEEKQKTEKGQE